MSAWVAHEQQDQRETKAKDKRSSKICVIHDVCIDFGKRVEHRQGLGEDVGWLNAEF